MPRKWKTITETISLKDALDYAKSDLQSLSEEITEWRDNIEGTPLENTSKYETVSECADILEDQSSSLEETVDNILALEGKVSGKETTAEPFGKTLTVTWSKPYSRYESRPTRMSHILAYLETSKEELEKWKEALESEVEDIKDVKEKEVVEEVVSDLDGYLTGLDDVISECESVEFPGMY